MSLPPHLLPQPFTGDPHREADRITKASGTSFSAGMSILGRQRRSAIHAVYAFCRLIDDIADGDAEASKKKEGLEAWRREVEAVFADAPVSAVGKALRPACLAYDLPKGEFLSLIDGMETDAEGPVVAPSRDELAVYTRRVAGTVGMLSIRIFGAWRGEVSDRFALALGDALQLTNIIRDVEDDARIGRVYLPRELLDEAGVPPRADAVVGHPALPAVRERLGAEAKAFYDEARGLAGAHSRARLRPALMMMGAYEGYLTKIERRSWCLEPATPLLTKSEKLVRGLRYAFFGPGRIRTA